MQRKILFLKNYRLELFFIILCFLYYLFFVNKGIVLYDEGYYFHIADRIIQGQAAYKDFFLQFTPGYFYFFALILKIFGEQIITGRFLILITCLAILFLEFKIADKLNFSKAYDKTLLFLATVSFGFPLINNPGTLAWTAVFSSLLLVYFFILWLRDKKIKNLIFTGLSLALIFAVKQNLGVYFIIISNFFLIFSSREKIKSLFVINLSFLIPTLSWIFYFIIISGTNRFLEFVTFNKAYASIYSLSYPFFDLLSTPFGIFKLIPYYLPILLLVYLIYSFLKEKRIERYIFPILSIAGFFGTVLPTSDLLHVYPFYSLVLISGLIFIKEKRIHKIWLILVILSIGIGFYLTFFREYYRYQPKYSFQNTDLKLDRTKGIKVDKPLASDLAKVNTFITNKTSKNDYILAYPFSPMLYFILERNNPSRYSIYYPGYLSNNQEIEVINEMRRKKVKYVVTRSEYQFKTPLSGFISSKKIVFSSGTFRIFKIE